MLIIVTGGANSGKSGFAEKLCCKLCKDEKIYIATMAKSSDSETVKRIERHRKNRSGLGFKTLEMPFDIADAGVSKNDTVLLECLGNLTANERYMKNLSFDEVKNKIINDIMTLKNRCKNLIIVSNEVSCDECTFSETEEYIKCIADINRAVIKASDAAVEMLCGCAVYHKGEDFTI